VTELLQILTAVLSSIIIVYFISANLIQFGMFAWSFAAVVDYMRRNREVNFRPVVQSDFATPVSVIAPAYNEGPSIVASVHSLLRLEYATFEVVVVNDGSKDDTLALLTREFSLRKTRRMYMPAIPTGEVLGIYMSTRPEWSHLVVVDKRNGGKADALNAGVNVSRYPLFCAIDADSLLEQDSLLKVAKPFLEDSRVVAVGGIVRVANESVVERGRLKQVRLPRQHLAVYQIIEYLRAFLSARMGWSRLNALLVISGAFGMFRKSVVISCGGYSRSTVGEDMELVVRIHRHLLERKLPYRLVFVPDPVCWTEAPSSLRTLARQRNRWHRGLLGTLIAHRSMIFNGAYGGVGLLALPCFLIYEFLAPVVEGIGYLMLPILAAMGVLNLTMLWAFFLVSVVFGVFTSLCAVLLEEISFHRYPLPRDLLRLLWCAILENLGYRQLTVWWRLKGIIDYVRGVTSWGAMQRTGFSG
jgi:cellulose synthase/poly-beta-1,6-N-acetylglucosamine synthase-like glycosyltransferase